MSDTLADRIAAGHGIAARRLGVAMDLYRPRDAGPALAERNRVMKLPVLFQEPAGTADTPWQAMLDSAYTRVGDYLAHEGRCWFIIRQPRLAPVRCVPANRVIGLARPMQARAIGAGDYAGLRRDGLRGLLTDWQASMLAAGTVRAGNTHLPLDHPPAHWTVRLPAIPGVTPAAGDRLTDDQGRAGIVSTAYLTAEGWRLLVKEEAA